MRITITIEKKHFIISGIIMFILACFATWIHFTTPPKVAIVYIATGRYISFWDKFYTSMEKNFLPQSEKHYFVFTNTHKVNFPENVTRVSRESRGFPEDSLDRFKMFLQIKHKLADYDYVYFLNANALVVSPVDEAILPTSKQGLTVAIHPRFYPPKDPGVYPYERNARSTAYIPNGAGEIYAQASFFGGRTKDFIKMSETLAANIKKDTKNNVLARWQDESHLNKYILDKKPLVLAPNYTWAPFNLNLLGEFQDNLKIIMRTKNTPFYGTTAYLRGETSEKLTPELKQIASYVADLSEVKMQLAIPVQTSDWLDYLLHVEQNIYCRAQNKNMCAAVQKGNNALTVHWQYDKTMHLQYDFDKNLYVPQKTIQQ